MTQLTLDPRTLKKDANCISDVPLPIGQIRNPYNELEIYGDILTSNDRYPLDPNA